MERVPGIDVSRWQREIDWARVAEAGYRFAFIRSTIGDSYTDPRFYFNWDEAGAAGLLISPYHVLTPDVSAETQIDHFFDVLDGRQGDIPPVLDVERDDGMPPETVTACALASLEAIEARDGRRPIIYTARWCWNRWVLTSPEWRAYDLWVASYTSQPLLPRDWATWLFWQYTDRGEVPGIAPRSTDLNWFDGSMEDLLRYVGQKAVIPDEEEPKPEPPNSPCCPVARVMVPELEVRDGPGDAHEVVDVLEEDAEVEVLALTGESVWVEFESGRWIPLIVEGERRAELKIIVRDETSSDSKGAGVEGVDET